MNAVLEHGLLATSLGVACSPAPESIGELPSSTGTTTSAEGTQSVGTSNADSASTEGTSSSTTQAGATVTIVVRATAEPFEHSDTWSGQTPRDYYAGIRSLSLIDTRGETPDLEVFDFAPDYVEASYNDGEDTVVAEVPAAELALGTFDRARVAVSHVRFTVDATIHVMTIQAEGEVAAAQVLSDGTELDGQVHDRGWWQYVFHWLAMEFPIGGDTGAPVTEPPPGGPIEVVVEGDETAIYFPVNLLVDPTIQNDVDVVLEVNVHESFRWEDVDDPDYATGVFDASPPSFEPIRQLGVNSYTLRFE